MKCFFLAFTLIIATTQTFAENSTVKIGVISTGPRVLPDRGCGWSPRPNEFQEPNPVGNGAPLYDVLGMDLGLKQRGLNYEILIKQGKPAELDRLAKDLVQNGVDFLVGIGTTGVESAQRATSEIPILFPNVSDPVADGFAKSWWQPAGNITGFSARLTQDAARRLELLKLISGARLTKVLTLYRADFAPGVRAAALMRAEAKRLNIELVEAKVASVKDIETALAQIPTNGVNGMIMVPEAFVAANNNLVVNAAERYKIPYMGVHDYLADWGAIGSLGTFPHGAGQEMANYLLRIRDGKKPGRLPITSLPSYFVVNLRAAKCLGIEIPSEVLKLADRVIPAR